ncbi:MAG: glutamate racemase, partial [Prevotella sp.]|nr:glutamate racemase [Prevotella sp.]
QFKRPGVKVVCQGAYVAESLADYLLRHPEMEARCSKGGGVRYLTTEKAEKFSGSAQLFLNEDVKAEHIDLG